MKSLSSSIVLGLALFLSAGASAQDAPKIAILDMGQALFNSEMAQEVDAEVSSQTAEDQQKVRELATQAQELQQQLQKDGATMSADQRKKLNDRIQEIGVNYQYLMQKLQTTVQERREEFQQAYAPNLVQAISEVVEEGGYTMVLRAEAVLHFDRAYDITAQVTAKLNEQNDD